MTRAKRPSKRVFIVTGLSGAGKTQALKCFEDFGLFCVDNLPVEMFGGFVEYLKNSNTGPVALGLDIRVPGLVQRFDESLTRLRRAGFKPAVLFLEAGDAVLVQRFSETRHRHPLGAKLSDAVRQERALLAPVKRLAAQRLDTSHMSLGELKETISAALGLKRERTLDIRVGSFGFKYGIPVDSDIVMDVRFLPNPHYHPKLRPLTGLDRPVQNFLRAIPAAGRFVARFAAQLRGLLPLYLREGKSYLTVSIGCTGGKHRSVFVAHELARRMSGGSFRVREYHRDAKR